MNLEEWGNVQFCKFEKEFEKGKQIVLKLLRLIDDFCENVADGNSDCYLQFIERPLYSTFLSFKLSGEFTDEEQDFIEDMDNVAYNALNDLFNELIDTYVNVKNGIPVNKIKE